MKVIKKRRLINISLLLAIVSAAVALVIFALSQNINLFYTPTEVAAGKAPQQTLLRLGGMVKQGSFEVDGKDKLAVKFVLTDFNNEVAVIYNGVLPDLFREGQGVVVKGNLNANKQLQATEVLAKHDENYMPPELRGMQQAATSGGSSNDS